MDGFSRSVFHVNIYVKLVLVVLMYNIYIYIYVTTSSHVLIVPLRYRLYISNKEKKKNYLGRY
jgi:hypothetical protein